MPCISLSLDDFPDSHPFCAKSYGTDPSRQYPLCALSVGLARHKGGAFILRIEDTDTERSTDAAVQTILDSMAWLSLDFDEGPFFQSQRLSRYAQVIADLLDAGLAYRCY